MTVVLDISRAVSRVGRGPKTGIDRVEHAYIAEVLDRFETPFFLAKIGRSFALIDDGAMRAFLERDKAHDWPEASGTDRLRRKLSPTQRQVRSFIRSQALLTAGSRTLRRRLERALGREWDFVNVGHSNLSDETLAQIRAASDGQIRVLVHDMIPLDFPEYTADGISEKFDAKMRAVASHADQVICNSVYTQVRVGHWFSEFGSEPKTIVAHLGVDLPIEHGGDHFDLNGRPTFTIVGTIEPRKNHALLLDVWDRLAVDTEPQNMPNLLIVGRRGWKNETLFKRLDASKLKEEHVFERHDVPDDVLVSMIHGSHALLFPSFAEGYGLPALEAALMGCPVICSDLPVFWEFLPESVTYLPADNPDAWQREILNQCRAPIGGFPRVTSKPQITGFPSWETHFSLVFGM